MKKILFRNVLPVILIYLFYLFVVISAYSYHIPDSLQSYHWILMIIIIPLLLGIMISRMINKKTLAKQNVFLKPKNKDYLITSIFLIVLIIGFILYDQAFQIDFLSKLSFSMEWFFQKFDEPYCYLNNFIPYGYELPFCFLSAFMGYSFYRILFDTSILKENITVKND